MSASNFEFLDRPYKYPRDPFRLGVGEVVGYEGRYFSIPASSLVLDKRLLSPQNQHPIGSDVSLYINKDVGVTVPNIEPTADASGYDGATPHYVDYITDLRDLLDDVTALHADDSDHPASSFLACHLERAREVYDIDNSSASGVANTEYVHPTPVATTPTNGELGYGQFQDIDLDEVMWQPFSRPSRLVKGQDGLPVEPAFPLVVFNGGLPSFSARDRERFDDLSLNVAASGNLVLVTGDVLVDDSVASFLSEITPSSITTNSVGGFSQSITWKQFPAGDALNIYYTPETSGACISARGRQALYNIPKAGGTEAVYALAITRGGADPCTVQIYPSNYYATSGIDPNGKAHGGVHNTSRMLYNLAEISRNNFAVGRSPINGKKLFGHLGAEETGSEGQTVDGNLTYSNGDNIYTFGGIVEPRVTNTISRTEWASYDKEFSPASWDIIDTTALRPRRGFFGARDSTLFIPDDIQASSFDGVVWIKRYLDFGAQDRVVFAGDKNRALGGDRVEETYTATTTVFQETNVNGEFVFVELPPPQSPIVRTQSVKYNQETYSVGNIFTNFLNLRPNHGLVHVNGQIFFQWSNVGDPVHRFMPVSTASRTTNLVPPKVVSVATYVVGFFPVWRIRRVVTVADRQISTPASLNLSPAASLNISFASDVPMTLASVEKFGPAVFDDKTLRNFIYFKTVNDTYFFAIMNTSFEIVQINEVDQEDAILSGRAAILSI